MTIIAAVILQGVAIIALGIVSLMQRKRILDLEACAGYQEARMDALLQVLHGKSVLKSYDDHKMSFMQLNLIPEDEAPTTQTWRVSNN